MLGTNQNNGGHCNGGVPAVLQAQFMVTSGNGPAPEIPATSGQPPKSGLAIYESLARHQQFEDWRFRDLAATLHAWAKRFDEQFKLQVPEMVLRIDGLSLSCYGHFRYGHNGEGLKGEIALNARYFHERELWEILGTLLHEQLHAWQQAHGQPGRGNYHNCEFRKRAQSLGLLIDERGVTRYATESPFKDLLRAHGVFVPVDAPVRMRSSGLSKMKKWTCSCPVNVRCAVTLRATCANCGQWFQKME